MRAQVGIVGFRGYSGGELGAIRRRQGSVEPLLLEHRSDAGERPAPRGHAGPKRIPATPEAVRSENLAAVFLATPAEVSMDLAPAMLEAGVKVIDLSGAFRLRTAERYQQWYKAVHTQPAVLAEAAYGLPEFCRERVRSGRFVVNPGVYST